MEPTDKYHSPPSQNAMPVITERTGSAYYIWDEDIMALIGYSVHVQGRLQCACINFQVKRQC